MRHSRQDAIDTASRRTSSKASAWHPILAAVEVEPGHWYMVDATNKCYGIIHYLTIQGQSGYRAVTWAKQSHDRRLIGYFTTLQAAAVAVHAVFLRRHGPSLPDRIRDAQSEGARDSGRGAE